MASTVVKLFADSSVSPLLLLATVGSVVVLFCWKWLFVSAGDSQEPPEIKSMIPFVGHLLGLIWYQSEYLVMLSRKVSLPVFTIRVFGSPIYVVNSPELIQKVFANNKAFTFDTFITEASRRLLDMDATDCERMTRDPGVDGGPSYLTDIHDLIYKSMAPGSSLSQMTTRVHSRTAKALNDIGSEEKVVGLFKWNLDVLSASVYSAMYGPDNPYEDDPSLIDSIWDLDTDLVLLLLQFFPRLIARKGFEGRARLYKAYRSYFRAGLWKNATSIILGRRNIAKKHGFSDTQIADYEISIAFPAVTNTVPVTFWFLSHILADPELANTIRKEVESTVSLKVIDGQKVAEMNVSLVLTRCPLLTSTWDEILRFVVQPTSVRFVTTDSKLGDEYLLRKGGVIQIPGGFTHYSSSIWGSDATVFESSRFLKKEEKLSPQDRELRKTQNKAYNPFGGGKHLCPGRHLALDEIFTFVAMLLYGFTVEKKDGTPFEVVEAASRPIGKAVSNPKKDVQVRIKRREELEGVKLAF